MSINSDGQNEGVDANDRDDRKIVDFAAIAGEPDEMTPEELKAARREMALLMYGASAVIGAVVAAVTALVFGLGSVIVAGVVVFALGVLFFVFSFIPAFAGESIYDDGEAWVWAAVIVALSGIGLAVLGGVFHLVN